MRGYAVDAKKTEIGVTAAESKWYLEPSARRRMWASLVFLQGALLNCNEVNWITVLTVHVHEV